MSRHQLKTLPSETYAAEITAQICDDNVRIRAEQRALARLDPNPEGKLERYPSQHLCSFFEQKVNYIPCTFAGNTNYELERHEWTHVDERFWEHGCAQCAKRFRQRSHLGQHIISVHEKRKDANACKCGHAASDPAQIKRHIKTAQQKDGAHAHGWAKYKGKEGAFPKDSPRMRRRRLETGAGPSSPAVQEQLPRFYPGSFSMPQAMVDLDFDNAVPEINRFAQSDETLVDDGSVVRSTGQINLGYDMVSNRALAPAQGRQQGPDFADFLGGFESELEYINVGIANDTDQAQQSQSAADFYPW